MSHTTKTEEEVTLKLLVNKETNKVIFAEAEKDFVDVLFSFLTFPLGTISRLLEKESSIGPLVLGSVTTLYHSVEDFDEGCFGKHLSKKMLLQPGNASEHYCRNLKLNIDDTQPTEYFICSNFPSCDGNGLIISINKHNCRHCGSPMTRSLLFEHFDGGFVKDDATFIITDDMTVMPNSIDITVFALLQNFGIKNATSVKEITVGVTKEKVLDLLKCSLFSKTPLTHLFLREKHPFVNRFIGYRCSVDNNRNCSIEFTVKLVIRKSDGKLLYAQVGDDFVKMLLCFLAIPLGGVVSFLKLTSLGSISTLYNSVASLDQEEYFVSTDASDRIVDPPLAIQYIDLIKLLPFRSIDIQNYRCYYPRRNYDIVGIRNEETFITNQYTSMKSDFRHMYVTSDLYDEVYVKKPRVYVATDDLVITPLSQISVLNIVNRSKTPFEDLMEKAVNIGINECRSIFFHFAVSQYIGGSVDLPSCSNNWSGSLVRPS